MGRYFSGIRLGAIALLLGLLAACSATYRNHGYVPLDDDLALVVVGEDNRESVAQKVGRPSSAGVLNTSGWYYVGSRWKHSGWRPPEEITREVVAISFDEEGVVENVERFGLEAGQVVVLSRRVTDSNVKGVSFIRQLLGNIGNFTAGQFLD
ncbi:outer membrane protein assembly factor BamE [Ostreiculturibacter nitratireducens]|uniref:outer membrane protein assembly factor BamE n=1 Tax=Ostreiculturibacter nitratireducens TaxID=3075226 RepID=UPI0031B64B84